MKSFAYSRDSTVGVFGWKYIGESTTYYPNGQLKSLEKFDTNGSAIDSSYYYYPTGKLKMLVTQVESGQNPFTGGGYNQTILPIVFGFSGKLSFEAGEWIYSL